MPFSPIKYFTTLLLVSIISCQQWYFPNSRMISDQQFREKILNDHSTYKLVKFFTPNCKFCRYLKDVIDKLKDEKQWSFQIYDLNCGWYPAFCNQIKAYSFPHTVIFNEKGQEIKTITGFYPYPVLKQQFDSIQIQASKLKPINNLASNNQVNSNKQKSEFKIINNMESIEKKQMNNDENKQKKQQIIIKKEQKQIKFIINQVRLDQIYQHIFFALCIFLGVVYFSSFSYLINGKKSNDIIDNPQKWGYTIKLGDHNFLTPI